MNSGRMSWARGNGAQGTWFLALSLVGCLGGQTGQEPEVAVHCEEETQAVALAMSTKLGFSAEDVIGAAGSALRAQARFFEQGVSRKVTLTLQSASAARLVTPLPGSSGCVERLEIDALLSFATDDGAFDESFVAALQARDVRSWSFRHTLPLAELRGSYSGSEYDLRTWASPRIRIDADLRGEDFSGQLWLEGDDPRPDDGSEPTSAYVAEWPFTP